MRTYSFDNNLLYVLSINIAPNGAVIKIEITAPVKITIPQSNPSDKAIAPIDAWTVAFGKYEKIINNFSFLLNLVAN